MSKEEPQPASAQPRSRTRRLVSLYLAPAEYDRVRAAAAAEGVSFQDFIRALLNRYVRPAPPAPLTARVVLLEEQVALLMGRAGIVFDLPADPDFSVPGELPKTRRAPVPPKPRPSADG